MFNHWLGIFKPKKEEPVPKLVKQEIVKTPSIPSETVFLSHETKCGMKKFRGCIVSNDNGVRVFKKWITPIIYLDNVPPFIKDEFSRELGNVLYELNPKPKKIHPPKVKKKIEPVVEYTRFVADMDMTLRDPEVAKYEEEQRVEKLRQKSRKKSRHRKKWQHRKYKE